MAIRYSQKNALLHDEINKLLEELKTAASSELVDLLYKTSWAKTKRHSDLLLVKDMPAFRAAALIQKLKHDRLDVWNGAIDIAARACSTISAQQTSEDNIKLLETARDAILSYKETATSVEIDPVALKRRPDPAT